MPFIKGSAREKYDALIDDLIKLVKQDPFYDRQNIALTYIIYKLLMKTTDRGGDIEQMFSALGILEATKLSVTKYFTAVEQRIESRRWLDSESER